MTRPATTVRAIRPARAAQDALIRPLLFGCYPAMPEGPLPWPWREGAPERAGDDARIIRTRWGRAA